MPDMRQEIITKVTALVETRFGGNWGIAFRAYAGTETGELGLVQVVALMMDARVGSKWTRSAIGRAIIKAMDEDENGTISCDEFKAYIENHS